jgi:hypothetical protein
MRNTCEKRLSFMDFRNSRVLITKWGIDHLDFGEWRIDRLEKIGAQSNLKQPCVILTWNIYLPLQILRFPIKNLYSFHDSPKLGNCRI